MFSPGVPLSQLLSALVSEKLAENIRLHTAIRGMMGNVQYENALHADDILLFVSPLKISIPAILTDFGEYSTISGYEISLTKSEAMRLKNKI